jgi:CTP:molybdopterin cytidylyltransferase MocA
MSPPLLSQVEFVLLAAGASTRMGEPKALLPGRSGRPLLQEWLQLAREAGIPQPWVVLGAHRDLLLPHLPDWARAHENGDWANGGATDSLRAVWPKLSGRVLFTPVDVPPCTPQALIRLASSLGECALSHQGTLGHPAALDHRLPFPAQRSMHEVMLGATPIPAGPECLLNLNTPHDYRAWLRSDG